MHRNRHEKLAGEAGVLAPYLGAQHGTNELVVCGPAAFGRHAAVNYRSFRIEGRGLRMPVHGG